MYMVDLAAEEFTVMLIMFVCISYIRSGYTYIYSVAGYEFRKPIATCTYTLDVCEMHASLHI